MTEKLPDYLVPNLRAVICGTAAGPTSAARERYYAGPGNEFWALLYESGLVGEPLTPSKDSRILDHGLGLTDLAKTVSASSDRGLREHHDVESFIAKIEQFAPRWIAFHGKEAATIVSRHLGHGSKVQLGVQAWRISSSRVFVLPSASGSNRDTSRLEGMSARVEWYQEFAKELDKERRRENATAAQE